MNDLPPNVANASENTAGVHYQTLSHMRQSLGNGSGGFRNRGPCRGHVPVPPCRKFKRANGRAKSSTMRAVPANQWIRIEHVSYFLATRQYLACRRSAA